MTTPSEKLLLAFRYILEAGESIEEAAAHANPYQRTARRQSLKECLEAARELLTLLENKHPDATTPFVLESGDEITITVPHARMVCYRTEASVMFRCYDDLATARSLMEHAIAIDPSDSLNHVVHGTLCSDLRDFPAAIASMERAISLEPDNFEYKRAFNDLRREKERIEAEEATKSKRSKWNPKSWLT